MLSAPSWVQNLYANTMLKSRMLFGSDFPLIKPDRWMKDFEEVGFKPEVRPLILKQNAVRLLRLGDRSTRGTGYETTISNKVCLVAIPAGAKTVRGERRARYGRALPDILWRPPWVNCSDFC
jgi:hypothetical protein